jgi:hypothetical protein
MSASEAASTGVCTVCFLFDERAELRDFERSCFRTPECLWDRNAVQVPLQGLARCDARPPTLVNPAAFYRGLDIMAVSGSQRRSCDGCLRGPRNWWGACSAAVMRSTALRLTGQPGLTYPS